ncbi:hypothetical protein J2785_006540 [Burkholderia ambifaria]|nr:hypothetical protein [Burkholderia ambifaria]
MVVSIVVVAIIGGVALPGTLKRWRNFVNVSIERGRPVA